MHNCPMLTQTRLKYFNLYTMIKNWLDPWFTILINSRLMEKQLNKEKNTQRLNEEDHNKFGHGAATTRSTRTTRDANI
jgi:hypothetical protein